MFLVEREKIWDSLQSIENNVHGKIAIIYDGNIFHVTTENTPIDLAKQLRLKINDFVACKIANNVVNLWTPFKISMNNQEIIYLTFNDEEGKNVFWHSSAHIMGLALETVMNMHLAVGPATKQGFYYEGCLQDSQTDDTVAESTYIKESDIKVIEDEFKNIVDHKYPFEIKTILKEDAIKLFSYNRYKVRIIDSKIDKICTVYKCGPFIDLCRGPHVPHTGYIKSFKVLKLSSSYFLGDNKEDQLQRVYGISFMNKKDMDKHLQYLEELKQRDHRIIGADQKLFMFNALSPGSCFFLPHGQRIYNKLLEFMKNEYYKRGYDEISTPVIAQKELWEISGHWEKYQDNMFKFDIRDDTNVVHDTKKSFNSADVDLHIHAICPMNCPKHCLVYKSELRSYRQLPIRYADFGVLHRNELKGALSGLTRVRKFSQDDAHIFCLPEQIEVELENCLNFLVEVYSKFGFEYSVELSTKPDNYIGSDDLWEKAENILHNLLSKRGKYDIKSGDGAFYGPKIDIHLKDAIGRDFQCGTIQLDFNLPERFQLEYIDCNDEIQRPVILHRAIYGSLERFFAILVEHYNGIFPLWLSPRQIKVIPVSNKFSDYSNIIYGKLREKMFYVDIDLTDKNLKKKVRDAIVEKYNYIVVVGQKDVDNKTITIRDRDNHKYITTIENFILKLKEELE